MDDRLLSVMLTLGCFILSIAGIVVWQRRHRAKDLTNQEALDVQLNELVRAGVRTPSGAFACIVCGVTATEYMPISGVSWMDKLPLLNRLYSLAPRYIIEDNVHGDMCLCRLHKQVAVRRLEKFHAMLRAERAEFNAQHEEKVASMDGGELVRVVMSHHHNHLKLLRGSATPVPQLSVRNAGRDDDDDEMEVALVTGGASIPPDDEDD